MNLIARRIRVLNYRNINDSGWIPLDSVTAFVGRNESGKTTVLKALHKFNPATPEPYNAQREFPRDRFTEEYRDNDADWPVCQIEFELSPGFREKLAEEIEGAEIPQTASITRFYDGHLEIEYAPEFTEDAVAPAELADALRAFTQGARRFETPELGNEKSAQALRASLADWAEGAKNAMAELKELRCEEGVALLARVREEVNARSEPMSADLVEALLEKVASLKRRVEAEPLAKRLDAAVEAKIPVFIYFENYGILDSAVHLPSLLKYLKAQPEEPRTRTLNAMFKHVRLSAAEIAELGKEEAAKALAEGMEVDESMIERDRANKELRNIKLSSASRNISEKFSTWFRQRRHKIRYQADGDYFRIWVSDDRRPDVEIELESRSKGLQWFFSFYLVFMVESDDGHKDAILLLDEPGLHLHPTAQQELLSFFEEVSENNPLIYTTHSPFLIDAERIHQVRPISEDEAGRSRISVGVWPEDREAVFPLQAAAGYAMVRGLFQNEKNILVENISDYLYLHNLNLHCRALGRRALPEDVHITPCGGAKMAGYVASLFIGQEVRPVVLLDADDAGKIQHNELMMQLYTGHENALVMLSDLLGQEECEIEDLIGEVAILSALRRLIRRNVVLTDGDEGALTARIEKAAERGGIELPAGWKPEAARQIVSGWSLRNSRNIPNEIIDKAEALFKELASRFE